MKYKTMFTMGNTSNKIFSTIKDEAFESVLITRIELNNVSVIASVKIIRLIQSHIILLPPKYAVYAPACIEAKTSMQAGVPILLCTIL